ncbi:MAG: DUF3299 domain-containing protein [Pseudomonadota bacterium]
MMSFSHILRALTVAILAVFASADPGNAQRPSDLFPSEAIWTPAPTPEGGVSWETLESTKEIQRISDGIIYSKPVFAASVEALAGTRIKVNGYMLPLQNSAKQTHFVLLAYPPDCPFHLNPAPTQFIEVLTSTPISVNYEVRTIEGVLELTGQDEGGIFYRMVESEEAAGA